MAFNDGVRVGPVAYIGLVSVIITFIIVLMLQVLYFGREGGMTAAGQAASGPAEELSVLTTRQRAQLAERAVVDRERGVVSIGISRAMELVVQELAGGRAPADVMGPPLPGTSAPAAPAGPADDTNEPAGPPPATDAAGTDSAQR